MENMKKIKNLTPHGVSIINREGKEISLSPARDS